MLNLVEIRNSQGDLLSFPLEDISEGFVLKEIEGLDPVKAILVSSSFANMDGEQYHSSRREPRNLIFKIGLEPDYVLDSVRDLRKRLYEFFMPKSEVELRFYMTDGPTVNITTRVESFQCPLFVSEPEASITVLGYDSDFIELNPIVVNDVTTSGVDEILTPYAGTVEAGLTFILNLDRSLSGFDIHHRAPDGVTRTLSFAASLLDEDVVTITTLPGMKGAVLTRDDVDTSILYAVSPQSNWIELQPGDNYIRVFASGDPIPFELHYSNRYGGL